MKTKWVFLGLLLLSLVGCSVAKGKSEAATEKAMYGELLASKEILLGVADGVVQIDMYQPKNMISDETFVVTNNSDMIVSIQVVERAMDGSQKHGEETLEIFLLNAGESTQRVFNVSRVGFYVYIARGSANVSGASVGFARFD